MIREKEVIKVDDKDYIVVSTSQIVEGSYAYMINVDNYNDVLFVKSKQNEIEVITDESLLWKLIPLFNKKLSVL